MDTIKIRIQPRGKAIGNIVRISNEARNVLQQIVLKSDVSASVILSELIIQGAKYIEFVDEVEGWKQTLSEMKMWADKADAEADGDE